MQELDSAMKVVDKKIEQLQMVRDILVSLNGIARTAPTAKGVKGVKRGKRVLSASARARIAKAQRARWAAYHAAKKKKAA